MNSPLLSLSETLERAGRFFEAEPAARSLVAEISDEGPRFAAIARGPQGGALLISLSWTETSANAALGLVAFEAASRASREVAR